MTLRWTSHTLQYKLFINAHCIWLQRIATFLEGPLFSGPALSGPTFSALPRTPLFINLHGCSNVFYQFFQNLLSTLQAAEETNRILSPKLTWLANERCDYIGGRRASDKVVASDRCVCDDTSTCCLLSRLATNTITRSRIGLRHTKHVANRLYIQGASRT